MEFWFINPVESLPEGQWQRIATDRPTDMEHGPSSMPEIQSLAAQADMAGYKVCLVSTSRPRQNDTVHDLYVQ